MNISEQEKLQDKIRKLLALSNNPEENEAKAALLKAQELMAKHKLTLEDVAGRSDAVVKTVGTKITFSRRKNTWIGTLSEIIASNYCCKAFGSHIKNAQTKSVFICGLEEDADICLQVLQYAVEAVTAEIEKRTRCVSDAEERRLINCGYGFGFCNGLRDEYERQSREHQEYGLVLLIPKDVQDEVASMKLNKPKPIRYRANQEHYASGYSDGTQFSTKGAITDHAHTETA